VVEGESTRPDDCIQLGDCVLQNLTPGLPRGTEIIVQFAYEQNGRLTVLARVPATRESAKLQIERRDELSEESLEQWRRRLVPLARAAAGTPGSGSAGADASSAVGKLDAIYKLIGEAAVQAAVPEKLEPLRSATAEAAREAKAASKALAKATQRHKGAASRAESIEAMTDLARARVQLRQAANRFEFACIALGRECVAAGWVPPECSQLYERAVELQRQAGQAEQ